GAEEWGLRLATYLRPFEILLLPLTAPLEKLSSAIARQVQPEKPTDPELATAEVEHFVDEVERSGVVGAEPAEMIRNVLEFEDRRAREVMVPRTRVEAINANTPLDEVRRFVGECGHSRYPVYEGQLDNVIGILVAKDVFKLEGSADRPSDELLGADDESPTSRPRTLVDVVRRDVVFVHEQQKLATLLREMRQKRQHLAVVVDEFGGTSGIVTMEDVIEEIVGDIRDEHDEESAPIQELGEGRLIANGAMHVEDLAAYLGLTIDEDDRAASLASAFEPSVEEGATITRWGLDLIAREVKSGQVERIEVRRPLHSLPPPTVASEEDAVDISAPPDSVKAREPRRTSDTAPKPSSSEEEGEDDDAPSRESGRREASNS
ncbi:MAG: HlyC/CorC family transporter, partial [Myxococcales bacterium]|nr:HlyC/CorC family transporter [Myxococcales bacterium]